MVDRVQIGGLGVAESLHRFVTEEALPGSGVEPDVFWAGLDAIVHDLAPRNRELIARREELQALTGLVTTVAGSGELELVIVIEQTKT